MYLKLYFILIYKYIFKGVAAYGFHDLLEE